MTRLSRWGVPELRGNGRLVAAAVIDSTGSGLVLALQLIYFVTTTSLPLMHVGAALTLAELITLPAPAIWGRLVDRFGSRAISVTGNLVSALGFAGFLLADSFWLIVLVVFVVQVGVGAYWTAQRTLVAEAVPEGDWTRWFGLMHALRNAGIGLGAALAAGALAWEGVDTLRWLVIGNIASYLLAVALLATWRPPEHRRPERQSARNAPGDGDPATRPGGYHAVLRDRTFTRLVLVNIAFVLAAMVITVLLAVYILEIGGGAPWMAAVALTVNTVLVVVTQTRVSRWVESRRPTRVMAMAATLNALAFIVFGLVAEVPSSLIFPGLIAAVAVYTLAEVLHSPAMDTLTVSLAPANLRGRYQGVFEMSWVFGGAIAPLLFTTLLAGGLAWPWLVLVILSLAAALALVRLEREVQERCGDASAVDAALSNR